MSSGWLPKHRQLFFQIFQEGPKAPFHVEAARSGDIPLLNPRNVNFMQRFSKQTGITAADDGREKWFHLPRRQP
jgi:hypothetical protein